MELLNVIVKISRRVTRIGVKNHETMRALEHHIFESDFLGLFVDEVRLAQSFATVASGVPNEAVVRVPDVHVLLLDVPVECRLGDAGKRTQMAAEVVHFVPSGPVTFQVVERMERLVTIGARQRGRVSGIVLRATRQMDIEMERF